MTATLQVQLDPGATGPTQRRRGRHRARRVWVDRLIPVLLMLIGAVVLAYPVVATFYNNYKQSEFAREYAAKVATADPAALNAEFAAATRYNTALNPKLLKDPWDEASSALNADYRDYLSQLDLLEAMGRIRIPALDVDLPVLHGTSDDTLAKGVGHLFGSSLPVGGPSTHAVLTGHSSLANATLFDHLPDLQVGDKFYIDVLGRTLAYQVDKTSVVLPNQLDDLAVTSGADQVTLVTCTPYAINSHRLLVRGVRVPYTQADGSAPGQASATMDWSIQSWMWPRLIGAGVAVLVLVAMILGWIAADRRRAARRAAKKKERERE
ncbi:MAG: class C sortase [Actinomycetales bacterium]|uniref:Class C sortase n=1 Tax=Candidatus Phosphoribacter hodrii TaxID=2953743 RepID=A0A935IVV7_9MICO|nr:class C sortase [Candidatus Phosphoribacter hodrii]